MREDRPERLVAVIAAPAHLVGADEVDEHVLVHQRQAEAVGRNRAGHRLHQPRRTRPQRRGRVQPRREASHRGDHLSPRRLQGHTCR